jgi:heptosyltransferase-1
VRVPEDRFLIIRLSSLGDIIHALPAFSALRKRFPRGKIAWIVEENGKEILDLVPGIDRVVAVQTKRWRVGSRMFWKELGRLRGEIKERAQTTLDFQGLVKSGLFAWLSKARRRLGFHRKNLREPLARIFYTEQLKEVSEDAHVIGKNLKLLSLLGIEDDSYEFPIQLPEEISVAVKDKLRVLGYGGEKKLVVLNVGAAWETKRWYPERWVALVKTLQSRRDDLSFLLLWGKPEEKELAENVNAGSGISIAPPLSLKEVIALVKEADLVVSGDTFALQAASALSKPVVGLFGPSNPRRNGPFSTHDRIAFHEMECSSCYKRKCSDLKCLDKITADEVAALCLESLEENA